VAAIIIIIAAGLIWIGPDSVVDRIAQSSTDQSTETFFTSRGWIWRDTVSIIKANPFFGAGLGAFQTAYPIYSQSNGSLLVGQAHNDYLQVLADGGIIGGLIALWFIILISRAIARGLKSRDAHLAGLALASGAGIFGLLVHSLFDFNLQIPSNALLFLLFSALASRIGATVTEWRPERNALRYAAPTQTNGLAKGMPAYPPVFVKR